MTDTVIGAFIGVGGAIIGVLLAGPVTYYFSRILINESHKKSIEIIKITEFTLAAAKLRAAFAPAQVQISMRSKIGNIGLRKIFDDYFPAHAAAIEEFRPFASDAVSYQKAYEEYRKALYEDDQVLSENLRWDSNVYIPEEGGEPQDFISHISEKINKILRFANH